MNKILSIALLSLFVASATFVSYKSFETVEAKTLTVETPVGTIKQEVPNEVPVSKIEANVPQDLNWSVAPTPTAKPTYVHKAKKAKHVHTNTVNNSNWSNFPSFDVKLPEVKF